MTVWAYGDSWTAGDQDSPQNSTSYLQILENERYKISYVAHFAKSINATLKNKAYPGSGNFPQLDLLLFDLHREKIKKNDIIIFGVTAASRDRANIAFDGQYPIGDHIKGGPSTLSKELFAENIWLNDHFMTLATLDKIKSVYGIRLYSVYAFSRPTDEHDKYFETLISDLSLMDVLCGEKYLSNNHPGHILSAIPQEFRHLFTDRGHPSPVGHRHLGDWLYNVHKKYEKSFHI